MEKTLQQDGVTYTFDMKHIFTNHKLWLHDFANIPHYFSVAFCNNAEYAKAKDRILPTAGSGVRTTGHEQVCGEVHIFFSANTKEDALQWKRQHFDPLFREQAVDFYKENGYLPYNFAAAFCYLDPGENIEFHGRIPCWGADIDKVNPLKEPQTWRVVSSNESKTSISRNGREYQLDTSSLFDERIFLANYVEKTSAPQNHVNCVTHVYKDTKSIDKKETLDEMVARASAEMKKQSQQAMEHLDKEISFHGTER